MNKKEILRAFEKQERELEKANMENPLAIYSTTQLKAEIRRRKKGLLKGVADER